MKHVEGCPSGDFGPCDCEKPMTSPGNASDDLVERLNHNAVAAAFRDWSFYRKGEPIGYMSPGDAARIAFEAGVRHAETSLRAQLASAKTDAKNFGEQMCATNDRLIAAQDQLAAARKALEPFVKHYESWMERLEDHEQLHVYPRHTMGDLRAALRSLDGGGK